MVEPTAIEISDGAAASAAGGGLAPAPPAYAETPRARTDGSMLGAICLTSLASGPIFLLVALGVFFLDGGLVLLLEPMMLPSLILVLIISSVIGLFLAIVPVITGTLLMVKLSEALPAMAHPAAWGAGGLLLGAAILAVLTGLNFPPRMIACLLITSVLCALLVRRIVWLEGE